MGTQVINWGGPANVATQDPRTNRASSRPLHAALVLSGGGAKGSFETGAVQFLYSTGFFAKTICGTSVGAVNALQLAHGGTPASQAAAATMLLSFWNAISPNNPFFVPTPLYSQLLNVIHDWSRVNRGVSDISDIIVWPIGAAKLVGDAASTFSTALQARAIFDMSPLRTKILSALNSTAVRNSGVSLRLCVVGLESGEVRYVDQLGRLLDREMNPIATPLGVAPECQNLLTAYRAAVTAKGAINQGDYLDERGRFDRRAFLDAVAEARRAEGQAQAALDACQRAHPPVPQPLSLVEATMASAAIPVLFAPVSLARETYVDGGVMLQLPTEAAVRANPDVIVAINTGKLTMDRKEGFATATVEPIAERTVLDLLMFEIMARQIELAEKSGKPIFMITPRFDVHSMLDQDPGLLSINMDYGFMCAADIAGDMNWAITMPSDLSFSPALTEAAPVIQGRTAPSDPVLAALADAITRARMRCWVIEHEVFGEPLLGAPSFGSSSHIVRAGSVDALDRLRGMKTLVNILAMTRSALGGVLPPASASWSSEYERHEWTTLGGPWEDFNSVTGTRPAATMVTTLVVVDENGSNFLLDSAGRFPITVLSAVLLSGTPAAIPAELYSAIPLGPAI